jgi:formylglycine-generating enzyme required for sulfatase activity
MHRTVALLLLPPAGLAGCELVTDFSPRAEAGAEDGGGGGDDGGGSETGEGADGTTRCTDVAEPCPPGMTYVACGPFLMGAGGPEAPADEKPDHIVKVSAFCVDTTEVTNAAYAECVRDGACAPPHSPASETRGSYYSDPSFADYPVVHVDWGRARTFCGWVGKRLPTESEWEKAARGGCEFAAPASCGAEDERAYPWGAAVPDCATANSSGCVGDTDRAGARPGGASPHGVQDMAGNVAEWVGDWYAADAYESCATGCTDPAGPASGTTRVVRGGSWRDPVADVRVSWRGAYARDFADSAIGFRCVAPVP